MSKSAIDFSVSDDTFELLDNPFGVEETEPLGPEAFDSFKDAQGRYRTQSLFIETPHESYPAFFTTKRVDVEKNGKTYISLYRKYMEIGDPTEYKIAIRLFGDWRHWEALRKSGWFRQLADEWREELRVRMASDRYHEMIDFVKDGGAQGIQATKWLDERYADKKASKRGRPSKAERERRLKEMTSEADENAEDAERLKLI